jgi:hypothetical protein
MAAVAAVEASNAFRTRMAFPSGLMDYGTLTMGRWWTGLDVLEPAEFGHVAGWAGKTVFDDFLRRLDPHEP